MLTTSSLVSAVLRGSDGGGLPTFYDNSWYSPSNTIVIIDSILSRMTRCPLGFDCALLNSCPSYILPCPDGFFCASYANHTHLDDLDYGYALLRTLWDDQAATESDKEDYVVPDRAVQSMCFQGFYCPNASTILVSLMY